MTRRFHETAKAYSRSLPDPGRRRCRGNRRPLRGAQRGASGAVFVRRRVPPHRQRPDARPAGRERAAGADPRRRAAHGGRRGAALLDLYGAPAGQVAAAARRPRARRLGRAPSPGAFALMKRILLVLVFLAPAGCERAAADRPGAQLAAKVNGTEISVHQLRNGAGGAGNPASVAQALEKVIDRELLVQKALAAKLDRDPQVLQSIDNARRQLLAQAYIERSISVAASAAAGSTRDEVRAFYAENPALFAERRIYRLRELAVSAPAEMVDVLRAEAGKARELDEVAAWLRSRNAKFSADALTQPAEQLPLSYLPQLARMKPGEIAVFATPLGASVVQLVHAEDAPLSEQQAAPLIEHFLAGRKRLETAAAEVKRLREVATIEYLGEFKRGH